MKKTLFLLPVLLFFFTSLNAQIWEMNVLRMDGGGWVTGMVIHPDDPFVRYVRTDVGGAFKWIEAEKKWKAITDWIPPFHTGLYGIDAIALDPNDPDILYLAMGRGDNYYCGIYKSSDKGESFTRLPYPNTHIDANNHAMNQIRSTGERLAVNPFNSNEIIHAMLLSPGGLWRTTDGGQNWSKLSLSASNLNIVFYDQFKQGHIYAHAYKAGGMYYSTDNGSSWSKLQMASGGDVPTSEVRRMEQGSDGVIYFTSQGADNNVIFKIVDNKAYDISPTTAEWETVPARYDGKYYWTENKGFQGVAVNPADPQHIICEGAISSCADHLPVAWFESKDGGDTWHQIDMIKGYYTPWGQENNLMKPTVSDIVWDIDDPKYVYHMDGSGIARVDITITPAIAEHYCEGQEEIVVKDVTSVPVNGEEHIFSGGADVGGFYHNKGIDLPPDSCIHDYWLGSTGRHAITAFDYCESQPNVVWAAGRHNYTQKDVYRDPNRRGGAYYAIFKSTDGGNNFSMLPWLQSSEVYAPWPMSYEINPLELQVSSTNPDNVIVAGRNPAYTKDGGNSWHALGIGDINIDQLFSFATTIENDPVNGNVFYAYVPFDNAQGVYNAKFYKTTDGGSSWDVVNSDMPTRQSAWRYLNIKASPGLEGDIWLFTSDNGLWHTTDGGVNWTEIPGFNGTDNGAARCGSVGVGPAGSNYAVFVLGEYNGSSGVWMSIDEGATWQRISEPGIILANYYFMEASNFEFGKIYLSSAGQGMRYFTNNTSGNYMHVSPANISVLQEATSETVSISSNTDWTVSSNQAWVVPSPSSGSDIGLVDLAIEANAGDFPREATITISGTEVNDKTISITQAGSLEYTLTTSATNGSVSLDPPGGSYPMSSQVSLTATPNDGYVFSNWTGDTNSTENPITITMDDDKNIEAVFSEIQSVTLQAEDANTINNGVVETSVSGYNGTGYVKCKKPDSYVQFDNVEIPQTTLYDVIVRSTEEWPDDGELVVNGTSYAITLPGGGTAEWFETTVNDVDFNAGGNTVKLVGGKQQNIDQIEIVEGITTTIGQKMKKTIKRHFYPNPVTNGTIYLIDNYDIEIFNSSGAKVLSSEQVQKIDVSSLRTGLYIIKTEKWAEKFMILSP
jgi:photosystem II stability/assembly factor-like uncharacterized protein